MNRLLPLVFCTLWSLPLAGNDKVFLKDGTSLSGELRELGGSWLELALRSGARRIRRKDIDHVELDLKRSATSVANTDIVIRRDGHRIRGDVTFRKGGARIQIKVANGNTVELAKTDVTRIIRKGDASTHGTTVYTAELGKSIDAAFERVLDEETTDEVLAKDERFLIRCGIFVIDRVRDELGKLQTASAESSSGPEAGRQALPSHALGVLRRVERVHRLKEVTSPVLEDVEPRMFEILAGTDTEAKKELLRLLFERFLEPTVPLAVFLAKDGLQENSIRGWVVDFLRRTQRNRELVEVYNESTGRAKLAAAVALGENDILFGIPTIIEALSMRSIGIRELAVSQLRKITGQRFQFHPKGSRVARLDAIGKWRAWWQRNEKELRRRSFQLLRDEIEESPERQRAELLWKEAGEMLAKNEPGEVARILRKCSQADPTFFRADLALGALLIVQMERPEEGLEVLKKLKRRAWSRLRRVDRYWLHYYSGEAYRQLDDLNAARLAFEQARLLDPDGLEVVRALAATTFRWATSESKDSTAAERRDALTSLMALCKHGIKLLGNEQESLDLITISDLPVGDALPFDRRRHNRSVVSLRRVFRSERRELQLYLAKCQALLGKRRDAITTLEDGLSEILVDERTDSVKQAETKMRIFLGLNYEELGRPRSALRQYSLVLRNLDPKNETCRIAVERLRRGRERSVGN